MVIVHGVDPPYTCWHCKFNELLTLDKACSTCCITGKEMKDKNEDGDLFPPTCEISDHTRDDFVINIQMPDSCSHCKMLAYRWSNYCRCTGKQIQSKNIALKKKPNWCPLEEVN